MGAQMDLTGLSRDDVAEVIGRLEVAQAAADVLAEAGLEPVIDLSDDGMMLSASWGAAVSSAEGTEPGWPVVIEDALPLVPALVADTGAAEGPDAGPAGGQDAEAPPPEEMLGGEGEGLQRHGPAENDSLPAGGETPPAGDPAEDAARGEQADGVQDLSGNQPGMTGPSARGAESSDQSPEPAAAVAESGGAAAEDPDLSSASPAAEPPAAVTGTAAAVEAPALPGGAQPAGQGAVPPSRPAPWTAEEDDRLIAAVAAGVLAGKSRQGAIYDAADALGRPRQGAKSHVSAKLSLRLDREIAAQARAAQGGAVKDAPSAAASGEAPAPAPVAVTLPLSADPIAEAALPKPRAKAARPVAPADLSGTHRRIWDWLDGIEYTADFNAADDLYMVDCFAHGTKVATLALDMGVDAKALLDRFKLVTQCIRDGKDRIQPDLQGKLGEVLRWRVKALAEMKAA
jgi:hypothetical protein